MTKSTLNIPLVKQIVLAKQANARQGTSSTKTRGEVSGGGKKPWRQKGTGRARAGSSRSPVWVGGGITFGPSSIRSFKQRVPKKMARTALAALLQHAKIEKKIIIEKSFALEQPKTKAVVALLAKHQVKPGQPALFVTTETQPELILAANNIPNVVVCRNQDLGVLHLQHQPTILMEEAASELRFGKPVVKTATKPKEA